MLYVASPDLFAAAQQLSEGQRRLCNWRSRSMRDRQGPVHPPRDLRRGICWRQSPRKCKPGQTWHRAGGAKSNGRQRSRRPGQGCRPTFEVPVLAPIAGEVVEQDVSAGQLMRREARSASRFPMSIRSGCWSMSTRRTCPMCAWATRFPFRPTAIRKCFTGAFPIWRRRSIPIRAPCRPASKPRIRAEN